MDELFFSQGIEINATTPSSNGIQLETGEITVEVSNQSPSSSVLNIPESKFFFNNIFVFSTFATSDTNTDYVWKSCPPQIFLNNLTGKVCRISISFTTFLKFILAIFPKQMLDLDFTVI